MKREERKREKRVSVHHTMYFPATRVYKWVGLLGNDNRSSVNYTIEVENTNLDEEEKEEKAKEKNQQICSHFAKRDKILLLMTAAIHESGDD